LRKTLLFAIKIKANRLKGWKRKAMGLRLFKAMTARLPKWVINIISPFSSVACKGYFFISGLLNDK